MLPRRSLAQALGPAVLVAVTSLLPGAASAKGAPKPLDPEHALKPTEGYFDEAFALEPGGARLALVRTDGATFAKLEIVDLATGKTTGSFDLPKAEWAVERLEPVGDGKGVVVVSREGTPEAPVLLATLIDGAGKAGARVGPAHAFGRPNAHPELLLAFDRKIGAHEVDVTYTVTPYKLETLAPVGKPRLYKAVGGELKTPPFRVLDFVDGYGRAVGEIPRAYVKKDDVREPPGRQAARPPPGPRRVRRPQPGRLGRRCGGCHGQEATGRARRAFHALRPEVADRSGGA